MMIFTATEQKLKDFLNQYATMEELDLMLKYLKEEDFDMAETVVQYILRRIDLQGETV